jgi:hypothetical protein
MFAQSPSAAHVLFGLLGYEQEINGQSQIGAPRQKVGMYQTA